MCSFSLPTAVFFFFIYGAPFWNQTEESEREREGKKERKKAYIFHAQEVGQILWRPREWLNIYIFHGDVTLWPSDNFIPALGSQLSSDHGK